MMNNFDEIEKFRKVVFNKHQVKQLFPTVIEQDLNSIVILANNKLAELQKKVLFYDISTLSRPTVTECMDEISAYLKELRVEYDTTGLEIKYKKIQKVLDIIIDNEYTDDLKIVEEIKKEYIETKILNRSSMLYLNKIYKQLTKENDDDKDTKGADAPRNPGGHWTWYSG